MKALILTADHFEDSELFVPYERLKEEGFGVDIATPEKGHLFHGKHGKTVLADLTFRDVVPEDYDLLLLPGGKAPETVRRDEHALKIARAFFKHNKPVAAICHGPQVLVSARLLEGRHATCYKSVAPELKDAGAIYEDREVVVDGNLITSREPADLPAFVREILRAVKG